MHAYLDRTVDPPQLPADNALVERLRRASGARLVRILAEASIDMTSAGRVPDGW